MFVEHEGGEMTTTADTEPDSGDYQIASQRFRGRYASRRKVGVAPPTLRRSKNPKALATTQPAERPLLQPFDVRRTRRR